eukprot:scaffold10571_cov154-Cylindrotheca_fusiformis.AAC.20
MAQTSIIGLSGCFYRAKQCPCFCSFKESRTVGISGLPYNAKPTNFLHRPEFAALAEGRLVTSGSSIIKPNSKYPSLLVTMLESQIAV